VAFYRRNLPHWYPRGKALFITWLLHRSIETAHCLARPEIAQIVVETLFYGEKSQRQYDLYAWVAMSNHVHILVQPLVEPAVFLKSVKGFTARQANCVLNRTGPFWQREFFDHWLRGEVEIEETVAYIQANPVRAGLVERPEEFRWSSASPAWRPELPLHTRTPTASKYAAK
jgi:REP element-mobilizing transposase RayT